MFEELRLLGPRREGIRLQTRRPSDIPNVMEPHPPPAWAQEKFWRLKRGHPGWEVRKGPTGIYNCVGHVWASRRTSVYDDLDKRILTIRDEDGYRLVDLNRELPVSGDVIAYWESVQPYKTFLHIGVVEMRQGITPTSRIAWVLSKWDSASGEVLHHHQDFPVEWAKVFGTVAIEFWTDRPPIA